LSRGHSRDINSRDINRRGLLVVTGVGVIGGLSLELAPLASAVKAAPFRLQSRVATVAKFSGQQPSYWGFYAPGVHSTFSTAIANGRDSIVLVFDACGGTVTHYDAALIALLREYQAPATLFINRVRAANNRTTSKELLTDLAVRDREPRVVTHSTVDDGPIGIWNPRHEQPQWSVGGGRRRLLMDGSELRPHDALPAGRHLLHRRRRCSVQRPGWARSWSVSRSTHARYRLEAKGLQFRHLDQVL